MRTFEGPGALTFHPRVLGLPMIVGVLLGACSGVGPTSTEAPDSETPALSAGTRDQTSATVTWTAPATDESISGYELQWRSGTDTAWTTVTGISRTATSYTITGLQPQTTYEVQMRALFATTVGAWSESITVSTTSDRLELSLTSASEESISVNWVAPVTEETISGYELQWRSSSDTTWAAVTGIASRQTSYTITGLQPETTYKVQVRALFATTAGVWSQSITVSTTSDRLQLSLTNATGESISVEWVAPATARSITGYELQVRGGSFSQWKTYTIPSTRTVARLSGLTPGTTYRLRARAMFGGVAGSWSAAITATTVAPSGPPSVVFICPCRNTHSEDVAGAKEYITTQYVGSFDYTPENFAESIRYEISETGDMLESKSKGVFETPPITLLHFWDYALYPTIRMRVIDDDVDEPDSTVTVQLLPDPRYRVGDVGDDDSYTILIIDDDDPPSLEVDDVTVAEGNSGTVNAAFTVSLSTASGRTVTVDWATSDGTATAGADYTAGNGALTFAAGETEKTFDVAVTGDAVDEDDETFTVTLSNAGNASIADATATGTITDDD